jgi:hypothetical protein
MDVAYDASAWTDLYLMVGGASAVLMGLIFVAVSLHLRPILEDRWLRGRAESALLALMSLLLISGAVLIPQQSPAALGVEIAVVALLSQVRNVQGSRHLPSRGQRRQAAELAFGATAVLLALLAGISLVTEWGGGLWLLLPAGALALASAVWNAWRLMVDVAAEAD